MTALGLVVMAMQATGSITSVDDWFGLDDVSRELWEEHAFNTFAGRYDPPPPGWNPIAASRGPAIPPSHVLSRIEAAQAEWEAARELQ